MVIRKIGENETKDALELILRVFMQYEAPDYSDEGVETFKRTAIYNEDYISSIIMYGAYENNKIVGAIATRNNGSHIALFFVDGQYHRKGIGKRLFQTILDQGAADEITVNSSPYAKEVYHHLGFEDTAPEQITDGIRYIPMIYKKNTAHKEHTMKILNFGSLNIDYTYSVPHFVRAGETLASSELKIYSGGKGLNQSIALSRSGAKVWHAGAVGKQDGEFLVKQLEEAGVNTELILRTEGKTGHAIIQREESGDNCILLYGGANQEISRKWIDDVLQNFNQDDWLILQNEINNLPYIIEKAHTKGMKIVLNPSPMDEKIFTCPLEYIDLFILNEIEAELLCGEPQSNRKLQDTLRAKFPTAAIVLTLGDKGSVCNIGEDEFYQKIYNVPVKDTTAAGDTFTGYFVGSMVEGAGVKAALDIAAKAAAIAVSRNGAAPSIPCRGEVNAFSIHCLPDL